MANVEGRIVPVAPPRNAGAVMGYLFTRLFLAGSPFGVDGSVGVALVAVYTAVMLVTVEPASRVSRLSPAEAVRHSE